MTLPKFDAMELEQIKAPFDHDEWLFEIKYDGFRGLACIEDGQCQLTSHNDYDYMRFKDLMSAMAVEVETANAAIDGEIVVLDDQGQARFDDLMASRGRPVFAAFDILWIDGEDTRDRPLWERKNILEGCLRLPHSSVLYVNHIEEQGEPLYQQMCVLDQEGIVCKPIISQ